MDSLFPTVEEGKRYQRKADFINKRELVMEENSNGRRLTRRDLEEILQLKIDRITQNVSKKFLKLEWVALGVLVTVLSAFFIPAFVHFNGEIKDIKKSIGENRNLIVQKVDEMSSNYLYHNAQMAGKVVDSGSAGRELLQKGKQVLAEEPELVEAINKLYADDLYSLPASAPRIILEKMEGDHGKDYPKNIAKRNQITMDELNAIIMASAYQTRDKYASKKVAGKN